MKFRNPNVASRMLTLNIVALVLFAIVFISAHVCVASTLNSQLLHFPCPGVSGVDPGRYDVAHQPFFDKVQNRQKSEFDGICAGAAYPPQILPAFQAKIISSDKTGFTVALPKASPELRFFLKSLAKLGTSHYETDRYAMVKDRADSLAGEMDSIPATGMYALALSAAQAENIVSKKEAIRVLRKIYQTVGNKSVMPRAYGVLPHFVKWQDNRFVSLAEYSTVDTALYYHSMLIAAGILGQDDIVNGLRKEIRKLDFEALTVKSGPDKGFITMGIDKDGKTIYPQVWRHWGGESALVLLLARMSGITPQFPVSDNPKEAGSKGNFFDGRGFIAEIQSLFYPQFDADKPDRLTGQNWLKARRQLLDDQIHSTVAGFPGTKSAEYGLYGYSCGEISDPAGNNAYCENGIKGGENRFVKPLPVIFPHYILMSSQVSKNPKDVLHKLEILEKEGLFTPWGLVESCDPDLKKPHVMLGSLNASFEAIAAYHLLKRIDGKRDLIYVLADQMPLLKDASQFFIKRCP